MRRQESRLQYETLEIAILKHTSPWHVHRAITESNPHNTDVLSLLVSFYRLGNQGPCNSKAQTLNDYTILHIGGMFPSRSVWPSSQGQTLTGDHTGHQPRKSGRLYPLPPPPRKQGFVLGSPPTPQLLQAPRSFSFQRKKKLYQFSFPTLTVPEVNKFRLVLRKPSSYNN